MTNLLRVVLVCLLTWSWLRAAYAQEAAPDSASQARAKVLFQEGRALVADGRYAEACPLFEQSSKLVEGIGTLFNLADCWERLRRTRSAAALYRKVERLALASGQDQRAQVASQRARNLESSLSKLLIRLEDPHTATNVRQNGEDIPKENLGSPFAVDPGTYQIVASSPGKRSWSLSAEVPPGAVIVTVLVPVLDDLPDDKPATRAVATTVPAKTDDSEPAVEAPPPALLPRPQPVREEPPRNVRPAPWRRPTALVLAGVGIGGMVAGAVFGAQFRSSNKDAENVCPASYDCSNREIAQHEQFVNDARRARTFSVIGFGVGLAALGSAAAIHFTTPPRTEQTVTASAEWSPYGVTATLRGRF